MIPMDDRLARLAIDRLLYAYAKGEQAGQVDWEDLDDAFAAADAAVLGRYQEILKGVIDVDAPSTENTPMNRTHFVITIEHDPYVSDDRFVELLTEIGFEDTLSALATTLLRSHKEARLTRVRVEPGAGRIWPAPAKRRT